MGFFSSSSKTTSSNPPANSRSRSGSRTLQPSGSGVQSEETNYQQPSRRMLALDANGLYILLSEQEVANRWHWGLYLHLGPTEGWIFHITRPTDFWFYDHRTSQTVAFSERVVTALKVANVPPDMHAALRDRIAHVPLEDTPQFGALTCRTWLLRALAELDNEGYVSIVPGKTVLDIETETKDLATRGTTLKIAQVKRSTYSRA